MYYSLINSMNRVVAPSYTARTTALIAATGLSDTTKINAINTFDLAIQSLPFGSDDVLYFGFLGDSTKNSYNFIDTSKYQLTFFGVWDFTNGMLPNGSSGYAKTSWIPSSRISNNNNGAIGGYIRQNFTSDKHFIGAYSGAYFIPYLYNGKVYGSINDGNSGNFTPARLKGGIDISRISSTQIAGLNDSNTYTETVSFSGLVGRELYIGAMNNLGTPYGYCNVDIVCPWASANAWTSSDLLTLQSARETLLTTLGLNV